MEKVALNLSATLTSALQDGADTEALEDAQDSFQDAISLATILPEGGDVDEEAVDTAVSELDESISAFDQTFATAPDSLREPEKGAFVQLLESQTACRLRQTPTAVASRTKAATGQSLQKTLTLRLTIFWKISVLLCMPVSSLSKSTARTSENSLQALSMTFLTARIDRYKHVVPIRRTCSHRPLLPYGVVIPTTWALMHWIVLVQRLTQ